MSMSEAESERYSPPYPIGSRGYADIGDLKPHPWNDEIFNRRDNTELVEEIEAVGFKDSNRLLISSDGTIVSGHRRWDAADKAGIERVPVLVEFDDPLSDEAKRAFLNENLYRNMTPGERALYGVRWERVERDAAEERLEEAGRVGGSKGSQNFADPSKGKVTDNIGKKIGVSGETYRKGKYVLENGTDEQIENFVSGKWTWDRAYRNVRADETKVEETPEIADGEYSVILADPPWKYNHQQTPNREIEREYDTMPVSDIADLDVPAAKDSVCYLWATAPKLKEALTVLESWGFRYVTNAVWDKQQIGMGYWFRGQHEHLLVGKRGDFSPPDTENRFSSVINADRGEHSAKPEEVYEIIDSAFPDAEKLEMFARNDRDGWETWGAEVES